MFVTALLTTMGTIFVTELSDKDALFLLALATKTKASVVFAAGSVASTITTAIIVLFGSLLIRFVPIFAIKIAGGSIMLIYAVWGYYRLSNEQRKIDERGEAPRQEREQGDLGPYSYPRSSRSSPWISLAMQPSW